MISSQKAQGLPLNVIILAAIGLIVMVVIIMIFYRESGETSATLKSCFTQGGKCVPASGDKSAEDVCVDDVNNPGRVLVGATGGCNSGDVCCLRLERTAPQ
ncbi:hypothetical protein J4457_06685 [Candidatus Woesearchaeota archaeon]|nr:hypothetical protein [Candidatus Woesearchaeota archaeon]